ncbi:hypothetical protein EZV62_005235 [Acer yangbiense]|uniref:carbonic anhydrase n=1 Tax=Acer yangbiense TaxID=1000413 RepID=A0A5C7IM92_9ROSI|nr:hypothetical protein EZV62_005235 [Acer yangbiense]
MSINTNNKSFLILISLLLLLSSHIYLVPADDAEADNETPFTYIEGTGNGPKEWGVIDPHWKVCGKGHYQSPIDLLDQRVQILPNLGELHKDYKPAPAVVKNRGHDISVFWKGDAGKLDINGTDYQLLQVHWHSPSEHSFHGSRYELELHAVHKSACGKLAVIAIVYKYGHPDSFLSRVLQHKSIGKSEIPLGIVNPRDIKFGSRKYYRYIGSLTVPPCTEGVVWTVVKKVRTVSREQVRILRETVHDGLKGNARPTQPLDGRPVWIYDPRAK